MYMCIYVNSICAYVHVNVHMCVCACLPGVNVGVGLYRCTEKHDKFLQQVFARTVCAWLFGL